MADNNKNDYLEQVQRKQVELEADLRVQNRAARAPPMAAPAQALAVPGGAATARTSGVEAQRRREMPQVEPVSAAVDVRITGLWRWQTVIVPPNAYVVHTRRGAKEPLHLGLGMSFPYNPYTDSFLVVPGAMQTILINAYCICKELQGLLVQGYVQWIVADFATAYKKLDFSDVMDPMKVVNIQLREQAEAAIKDKVATMGIDDVLSDKQPIIQELTARLRAVAEGEGHGDKGLGLRIVTVQIKEAVVSSSRLWENLQKPFRSERERVARLAELSAEQEIQAREMEHRKKQETAELNTEAELALLRSKKEAETFDREKGEQERRQQREQSVARAIAAEAHQTGLLSERARREMDQAKVEHERLLAESRRQAKHQELLKEVELALAETSQRAEEARAQAELERAKVEAAAAVARLKLQEDLARRKTESDAQLALAEAQRAAQNKQTEAELQFTAARQRIDNDLSANHLQSRFISTLPELAKQLPKPAELRSISLGEGGSGANALASVVAQLMAVLQAFQSHGPSGAEEPKKAGKS